jgi:hypothetical protein
MALAAYTSPVRLLGPFAKRSRGALANRIRQRCRRLPVSSPAIAPIKIEPVDE